MAPSMNGRARSEEPSNSKPTNVENFVFSEVIESTVGSLSQYNNEMTTKEACAPQVGA